MAYATNNRVQVIKKRGATIAVQSQAEVLMLPTGDIGKWTQRFSRRVGSRIRQFAPDRKRPRWGHEDPKTLAGSVTVSTSYSPETLRVYAAAGVLAGHAIFVERGTAMYNLDNPTGPYEAKILPPTDIGKPDLYERTYWYGNQPARKMMIKGQKPQLFMARGLDAGMLSMKLRAYQLPDLGGVIAGASDAIPESLVERVTTNVDNAAFRANLEDRWRVWRDSYASAKKSESRKTRGRLSRASSALSRSEPLSGAQRQAQWRERNPDKVARQNLIRTATRKRDVEAGRAKDRRDATRNRVASELLDRSRDQTQDQFESSGAYQQQLARVTGLLRAKGLTVVGSPTLLVGGTFRARVRKPGSRQTTTISGKWH